MKHTLNSIILKKILLLFLAAGFYNANAQTISNKDRKFAECAVEAALLEIDLGQLAQTKAGNPEVKKHAQEMITYYTKANQELKSVAAKKNISVPSSLDKKMQKKHDGLAKLNGADFDKKYAKCMVHHHKKTVCIYKKESKRGKDPELKDWAAVNLAAAELHLTGAKEVCKALKK